MSSSQTDQGYALKPTWTQKHENHIRHTLSRSGVVINAAVSDKYIALSLDDKAIHVFTAAGEPLVVFRDHLENAWSLALQDDVLLTGEMGGDIRCWDLKKRDFRKRLTGHTSTVRCLKFIGTTTAISASRDTSIKIWDVETGACQATLSGHTATVNDLSVIKDHVISVSADGNAKIWSLSQRKLISTLSGHTDSVRSVTSDGQKIVTGGIDADVRVWELITGNLLAVLEGHDSIVSHLLIVDHVLVTGGADGKIVIWSLLDYTALHKISNAHENSVTSLDVRNGFVLSGGSDGNVKLWDLKTAKLLGDLGTQTQAVWSVSLGPVEGESIIVASKQDDAFLDIWPLARPLSD